MRKYFLCVTIIIATISCSKHLANLSENVSYTNPLLPSGADPWVIQKDSNYYYTNTLGNQIMLWKTKSISRLGKAVSKTVWTPPANSINSYDIWAPELHFLDDKWYLYYAAGSTPDHNNQRLFVLENASDDPLRGEWKDKGQIKDIAGDTYSIDATVFEYANKRYLVWSSLPFNNFSTQALFIAEMTNPWTLSTHRSLISSPEFEWEKVGYSGGNGVNEGPEILKNLKGQVFLVYSASSCFTDGYTLGILSLREGGDPLIAANWQKNPLPVLTTQSANNVFGPGHNSFFKSPDGKEDWIIYHANLNPAQGCSGGRNPRIQKFTWNADGTPNFGEPVPAFKRLLRPSGEKD